MSARSASPSKHGTEGVCNLFNKAVNQHVAAVHLGGPLAQIHGPSQPAGSKDACGLPRKCCCGGARTVWANVVPC
jgi:hypothetical protein